MEEYHSVGNAPTLYANNQWNRLVRECINEKRAKRSGWSRNLNLPRPPVPIDRRCEGWFEEKETNSQLRDQMDTSRWRQMQFARFDISCVTLTSPMKSVDVWCNNWTRRFANFIIFHIFFLLDFLSGSTHYMITVASYILPILDHLVCALRLSLYDSTTLYRYVCYHSVSCILTVAYYLIWQ